MECDSKTERESREKRTEMIRRSLLSTTALEKMKKSYSFSVFGVVLF